MIGSETGFALDSPRGSFLKTTFSYHLYPYSLLPTHEDFDSFSRVWGDTWDFYLLDTNSNVQLGLKTAVIDKIKKLTRRI